MRKYLMLALAALTMALAAPLTASAAPVAQGEGLRAAVERILNTEGVRHRRWHCRRGSGYCGPRRYYVYPRYRYRYYYYPRYRYYRYAPRYRYYRYYRW